MGEACQVCSATAAEPLVTQEPYDWVCCTKRAFAWISPMPDGDGDGSDNAMSLDYIRKYGSKADKKMRRARRRVRALQRRMPGSRLLDVGCNIGFVVGAAQERGLQATGVDVDPILVEEARRRFPQNEFIASRFEDAGFALASFDGVYTSEVIEHVVDANSFLDAVHRVLVPKGALYLTTPALHEYVGKSGPENYRDFGAPDHKIYFSPDNMRDMLAKHGFSQVRIRWSFGRGIKLFARRS